MAPPPTVKAVLDAALIARGWSVDDVASACDIPAAHLRTVLRGDWSMSPRIAARAGYVLDDEGLCERLLVAQALWDAAQGRAEVADVVEQYRREQAASDA